MAIVAVTNNEQEEFVYKEMDKNTLKDMANSLLEVLRTYVNASTELKVSDIGCDFSLLFEIIVRIDKRKDYFKIFHANTDINEAKEAALIAYWIMKFRPFGLKHKRLKKYDSINEIFAIFIILSAVKEETNRDNKNKKFFLSSEYIDRMAYGFKYWDLSKEALMLVSESLCEAMRCK